MRATAAVSFILALSVLPPTLRAQEPADSAPRDTTRKVRPALAIEETEAPPRWVGARVSDLLTARRAGLHVSPAGGALGSVGRFRIRGLQTIIDDRMPLVILDGIRLATTSAGLGGPARLEDLNPEEIASIDVIPGAAGSAVYGPGAANGVIVIRTREGGGTQRAPRWETYTEAGVRQPYRQWPARYGGIDADNPDAGYRTGDCTLLAVAAGQCVQDAIVRVSEFGYSGQLRTAAARQYGIVACRGSTITGPASSTATADSSPCRPTKWTGSPRSARRRAIGRARPSIRVAPTCGPTCGCGRRAG